MNFPGVRVAIKASFREQIQRNSVALISLFVAVSSLSYNTWRNELSEYNRNQRVSSFEILLKLGELQELVFHNHYDRDAKNKGNPRTGWALVLTVQAFTQSPSALNVAWLDLTEWAGFDLPLAGCRRPGRSSFGFR